jgi:hypothetical protein
MQMTPQKPYTLFLHSPFAFACDDFAMASYYFGFVQPLRCYARNG